MKKFLSIAAVCLCASLVGCESTEEAASPGAVGTCGSDCEQACCQEASPGAVSESSTQSSECASQCPYSGGA